MKKQEPAKLTPENLRNYQWRSLKFIVDNFFVALLVDMGLGKTISVLSAIKHLFYKKKLTGPVLLVAPIRVIYSVWRQEAMKWKHTSSITFSLVHGGAKQRMQALTKPAHIYLVNPEGVRWLIDYYTRLARGDKDRFERIWPFKMLVVDESTFFKEGSTQRFKALKRVLHLFERRVILTGTPTPNSLLQIWAQMYIVDMGARLGTTFSGFRERFFQKQDYMGYSYGLRDGAEAYMDRLLRPIVLRLQDSDWLEMPGLVKAYIDVELPPAAQKLYEDFEREMFLELETAEVEALNAATLTGRCHQIANGAIYAVDKETGAKDWHVIHDAKIEALKEYIEEMDGKRAIIAYTFKHDLERLMALLPDAPVLKKNADRIIEEWKAGQHQFIIIHPQSGGHGINNLQINCRNVLFYSIPWSGEAHDQLVARVGPARRAGEEEPTVVHYIRALKTVDEVIVTALDRKAASQRDLLSSLRDYHKIKEEAAYLAPPS